MNFLVKGVMIGGFALAAAPAEYRVTGVKTFIVSHERHRVREGPRPRDAGALPRDGALQPGLDLDSGARQLNRPFSLDRLLRQAAFLP